MNEYINIKTGVRLSTPDIISGENWRFYGKEEKKEEVKEEPKKVKEEAKEESDSSGITKKDIMTQLDAMGIEYNRKARKDELYKLMMEG